MTKNRFTLVLSLVGMFISGWVLGDLHARHVAFTLSETLYPFLVIALMVIAGRWAWDRYQKTRVKPINR